MEQLVRKYSTLKGLARWVLLAIAHYTRDDGKGAYPSVPTLARDTGSTDRGVQKAIKRAVNAGELKRLHNLGPNGVNRYEVRIDNLRGKADRTLTKRRDHPRTQFTPEQSSDKEGSVFREALYSSPKARIKNQPFSDSPDAFAEKAKANRFLTCPDCGRYGGRCNCDSELQAGFDRAMHDTLDAGKPGLGILAGEIALRAAYARSAPQTKQEIEAEWEEYDRPFKSRRAGATRRPLDGSEHGGDEENASRTHSHAFSEYL